LEETGARVKIIAWVVMAFALVFTGCSLFPDGQVAANLPPVDPGTGGGSVLPPPIPPSADPGTRTGPVKVGAFNIEIFGPTKAGRSVVLGVLAGIATTYDVLAIEEVGSNGIPSDSTATAVMDTYIARINQIAGAGSYAYVRGNQYAIVYRRSEFTLDASSLYSGTQTFTYQPLTAHLKSTRGNFGFAMLVVHTSPSKALTEIPELKVAMSEVGALYKESDVMALGDFNADGSYYVEGSGSDLAGFEAPAYISAISNSADTTVAASVNTYDRIELSASMTSDYASSSGVINFGQVYDMTVCEGTALTAGTESAVSDHYPVWAEFYVDKDAD